MVSGLRGSLLPLYFYGVVLPGLMLCIVVLSSYSSIIYYTCAFDRSTNFVVAYLKKLVHVVNNRLANNSTCESCPC